MIVNKFIKLLGYLFIVMISINKSSFAMNETSFSINQDSGQALIATKDEAMSMKDLRDLLYLGVCDLGVLKKDEIKEFLTSRLEKYDLEFLSNFRNHMMKHHIHIEIISTIDLKIYKCVKQLIQPLETSKNITYLIILAAMKYKQYSE